MRRFIFVLFFLVTIGSATLYDDLKGVWSTHAVGVFPTHGCRNDVHFDFKTFVSFNSGPDCDNIPFIGTYSISPLKIVVSYAYYPPGEFPASIAFDYVLDGDKLYLSEHNVLNFDLEFTRVEPQDSIDGVWTGFTHIENPSQDLPLFLDIQFGFWLAYQGDFYNTQTYYGLLQKKTTTLVDLVYVVFGSGPAENFTTQLNTELTHLSPGFKLVGANSVFTTQVNVTSPATNLDGVYTAFQNPCFLTIELKKGLFRSLLTGQNSCRASFMGPFRILDSHSFEVHYSFTNSDEIRNLSTIVEYQVDGELLTVSSSLPAPFNLTLTKISSPPALRTVRVVLNGDISSFDEEDFIQNVADAVGIPVTNVIILSVKSGSIIVDMALVGDQSPGGKDAQDAVNVLSDLKNLSGYPIKEVTDTTNKSKKSVGAILKSLSVGFFSLFLFFLLF